jgi:hypothetical protein
MQKTSVVGPVLTLALAFGVPPASRAHDPHDRHRTFHVSTAAELVEALATVDPGDTIRLRPGIYTVPAGTPAIPPATIPEFGSSRSGTPRHPIRMTGPASAVLQGGPGYGFHLVASHWRLDGFTVTRSIKGVVLDGANDNVLTNLTVYDIRDEGVHFRSFSSDNTVERSWIYNTGITYVAFDGTTQTGQPGFGEGVYLGSAVSNWGRFSAGGPDTCDRNRVLRNRIGPNIAAEGVDIKEGTTGGVIRSNSFDGAGISGQNSGDSVIDAKGSGYLIEKNAVANTTHTAVLKDGFQTHRISNAGTPIPGSGNDNVFQGNTIDLESTGFGVNVNSQTTGNVVCSDNTVVAAGSGAANVPLTEDCGRH